MLKFFVGQRVCWLCFGLSVACFASRLLAGEHVGGDIAAMGGWLYEAITERQLEIEKAAS